MRKIHEVAIVGGGPAALAELIRLQGRPISVVVVSDSYGGCMSIMGEQRLQSFLSELVIEGAPLPLTNFMRGDTGLNPTGTEYAAYIRACFDRLNHVHVVDRVRSIGREGEVFSLELESGSHEHILAWTVVVATGTRPRPLLEELPADAAMTCFETYRAITETRLEKFVDKHVLVVGSGNTAFQLGAQLARTARVVTILAKHYPGLFPIESTDRFALRAASARTLELIAKTADATTSLGPLNSREVPQGEIYLHMYRELAYERERGELVVTLDSSAKHPALVRASTAAAHCSGLLREEPAGLVLRGRLSDVMIVSAIGVEPNLPAFRRPFARIDSAPVLEQLAGPTQEPGLYIAGGAAGYSSVNTMVPTRVAHSGLPQVRSGTAKLQLEGHDHNSAKCCQVPEPTRVEPTVAS